MTTRSTSGSGALTSVLALTLAAGLTLAGCESPAGEVSVLTSDSATLRPGSTFAWAPLPTGLPTGDPRVDNDIIRGRIRTAVETMMAAKGYRQASGAEQAQLLVSYHLGIKSKTGYQVDTVGAAGPVACGFRGCIGYGWGAYGAPMTTVTPIDYTDGALLLDVVDRASGKLAWQAISHKRVDKGDGDQASINAVVMDMTKTLPGIPPAKG